MPADEINVEALMADLRQVAVRKGNNVSFKIARKPTSRWADSQKKVGHRARRSGAPGNVALLPLLRLDGPEFVRKAYIKVLGRRPDPAGAAYFLSRLDGGWAAKIGVLQALRASEEWRARRVRIPGLTFAIICRLLFSPPELKLKDLMAPDGPEFINNAYRQILGRDADSTGLTNLLGRLDGRWVGKISVLSALRFSQEGRSRNVRIGGLLFARVRRKFFGSRYIALKGLMAFEGSDFIDNAYRQMLGREPDSGGYTGQLRHLEHGWVGKIRVLASLYSSPEGRARDIRIRGLPFAILLKNLYLAVISLPRRLGAIVFRRIGRFRGMPRPATSAPGKTIDAANDRGGN